MTKIEWTHVPDGQGGRKKGATLNPLIGCSEVSEACRHCYAARQAARGMSPQHRGLTVVRDGVAHWNGKFIEVPSQLAKPLGWRAPRGIFWGSMTDLAHESRLDTEAGRRYLARCFGVMRQTPQHTHLILTKRPGPLREWFAWAEGATDLGPWPMPNVWIGATAENQIRIRQRIGDLLAIPAAVHFLSIEPMGSRVVLPREFLERGRQAWVIAGGESGPRASPSHPDWFRDLRDQCEEAGVPFFFKQWGEWSPVDRDDPSWTHMVTEAGKLYRRGDDVPLAASPSADYVRRVGKVNAGRMLDGRTWDEFPGAGATEQLELIG